MATGFAMSRLSTGKTSSAKALKTAWADPTVVVEKGMHPLLGMRTGITLLTPEVEGVTTAGIVDILVMVGVANLTLSGLRIETAGLTGETSLLVESFTVREGPCHDQELTAVTWRALAAGIWLDRGRRINLVPLGMTGDLTGELIGEMGVIG